jgi:hypothetical protein
MLSPFSQSGHRIGTLAPLYVRRPGVNSGPKETPLCALVGRVCLPLFAELPHLPI